MRKVISKALIAGFATLSLTASVIATAEPAAAGYWHGGGGWHGGGWHGGGWHGGGWHGGGWHGGGWYGGWGPAVVGGVAAGALLAAPYYGGDCYVYRPTYDGYGNYTGRQLVNGC
jgi:hypothetical protein